MKVGDLVKDRYDTAPGIVMDMDFSEEMPIRVYYKHTGEFSAYYDPEDLEIVTEKNIMSSPVLAGIFGAIFGFLLGFFI